MIIRMTLTAVALAASGLVLAKLPPLDDAAKAKAAETAAKAAWQGKVDAYKLCQVQDRIAAQYRRTSAAAGRSTNAPGANAPNVNVAAAASATPGAAPPAAAAAGTAAGAAATAGTPVTTSVAPTSLAACMDPGPFAYNPPAQTPLETSGAHSPAGNAAAPPSVRPESAKMAPSGPTTSQSKKP